jgi:hypothetical protein
VQACTSTDKLFVVWCDRRNRHISPRSRDSKSWTSIVRTIWFLHSFFLQLFLSKQENSDANQLYSGITVTRFSFHTFAYTSASGLELWKMVGGTAPNLSISRASWEISWRWLMMSTPYLISLTGLERLPLWSVSDHLQYFNSPLQRSTFDLFRCDPLKAEKSHLHGRNFAFPSLIPD